MLRLRALTLARGGKVLLRDAQADIAPGERIALVGPNGSGKSTLLDALSGELSPERGDVDGTPSPVVRLSQALPAGSVPAWRWVVDADSRLAEAAARLHALEAAEGSDGLALADAHEAWQAAGGLDAQPRALALLAGLGFDAAQANAPVDALSGGWRMRLNLACALFVPSALLLLDEPTNHLDLDAILWLERWLARHPGTVIAVSHDRDFLDRIARATLAIEDGRLVRYSGGYSDMESQRAARQLQQRRSAEREAARAAHLQRFIDRFRAQATRARQVQSRLKALERLQQALPARAAAAIDIDFGETGDTPDPMLVAEDLAAGHGSTPVLRGVGLQVRRGDRIGLLGRNGAGKTTLVRTLVGELAPLGGELRLARGARVGYFAQQAVERLRPDETPLQHLARLAPDAREQALRDHLGRFGLRGDDALRPTGPMSGGEKSRLVLAMIVWTRPQLLVLDEPTNHLDGDTRDALADALAAFEGAVLLVSHDRYLLRATAERLVLVHDGGCEPFDGDLEDYARWSTREPEPAPRTHAAPAAEGVNARESASSQGTPQAQRRLAAERRAELARRLKPIEAEIAAVERELDRLRLQATALDRRLADPALYARTGGSGRDDDAAALHRQRAAVTAAQAAAEERWLSLAETREQLARAADAPA